MVTRLLNLNGLYLGPDDALMPPHAEDNPRGYWEHLEISALNDALLEELGGSWNQPPAMQPGWHQEPALDALRQRARTLIAGFDEHALWGFKDPRCCLTLAFWQDLIPDLKLVLCVRNPREIALSLSEGNPTRLLTQQQALHLWSVYHERLLSVVSLDQLTLTHYAAYFYDPEAELQRLLDALDFPETKQGFADALATIEPTLHRQVFTSMQLPPEDTPEEIVHCYDQLCQAAGPVFHRLQTLDAAVRVRALEANVLHLHRQLTLKTDQLVEVARKKLALEAEHEKKRTRLEEERDHLLSYQTALDEEHTRLKDTYQQLQAQHLSLMKGTAWRRILPGRSKTWRRLAEENEQLRRYQTALEKENKRRRSDQTGLEKECARLVEENKRLLYDRDVLEKERVRLEGAYHEFEAELLALKHERARLVGENKHLRLLHMHMNLEQPTPDYEIAANEALTVAGWAFSRMGRLSSIDVFLDNNPLGTIIHYPLIRPDV